MKKIVLLFLLMYCGFSYGQTSIAKAQAMYIYNFARLIEWPSECSNGNFVIGILGTSNLEVELVSYCSSKKIGFQSIEIKKFKNPDEIKNCHILFISYGKSGKIEEILPYIKYNTLIITEKRGMISNGSGINFIIGESKLQFELSVENINKYSLNVSTRLIEMANK